MRGLPILALCILLAAVASAGNSCDDKYTTEYDDIDIDEILHGRLLEAYIDCLLVGKRCTVEGKKLKEVLPNALQTDCCRCSDKQKSATKKVIRFLIKERPEDFKKLEATYDKEHKYREKYGDQIRAEGLTFPV